MAFLLVVGHRELVFRAEPDMESLETRDELVDRHVTVRFPLIRPVLLLVLLRSHLKRDALTILIQIARKLIGVFLSDLTSWRKSAVPFRSGQTKPQLSKKSSTNSRGPW